MQVQGTIMHRKMQFVPPEKHRNCSVAYCAAQIAGERCYTFKLL